MNYRYTGLVLSLLLGSFSVTQGMQGSYARQILEKIKRHPVASAVVAGGAAVTIAALAKAYWSKKTAVPAVQPQTQPDGQSNVSSQEDDMTDADGYVVLDSLLDSEIADIARQEHAADQCASASALAQRELNAERAGMEAAIRHDISERMAHELCNEGVLAGAREHERVAAVPTAAAGVVYTEDAQLIAPCALDRDDAGAASWHEVLPSVDQAPQTPEEQSAKRGSEYLARLWLGLPGRELPKPNKDSSYKFGDAQFVQAIVDIIWYLYQEAALKGEQFEEGTFILKDPNFALFNLLLEYVKLCDPQWQTEKYHSECYAYCRASSHLKEYYTATGQAKLPHYGIYPDLTGVTPLPAHKHHIFFGVVDTAKQLIFIKPENAGLSSSEITRHVAELGRSVAVKATGSHYDDAPNFRKERVPKSLRKAFMEVAKEQQVAIEGLGIQHMVAIGLDHENPGLQKQARECCVRFDHIPLRMGREVIFTPEDLISAAVSSLEAAGRIQEAALMREIVSLYTITKQCIRALKRGEEITQTQEKLKSTYAKLHELVIRNTAVGEQYARILGMLAEYCDRLDIFCYASSSELIETILKYEYLLEDVSQALPACLQKNVQRRADILRKKDAIFALGKECKARVEPLVATEGITLSQEAHDIDPRIQAILDDLFDEYVGIRKLVRDARTLGVIDGSLSPCDEQYKLPAIVAYIKEKLTYIAQRSTAEALEAFEYRAREIKQIFAQIRLELLHTCGKKSTRDANELHARATHQLHAGLIEIFEQSLSACRERLFGPATSELPSSPCTDTLDAAEFKREFEVAVARDRTQQELVIDTWMHAFSKEESFIDLDQSEAGELQKLVRLRIENFGQLCSKETGMLEIYEKEKEVEAYRGRLQKTLTQAVPVAIDTSALSTAAAAAASTASTVAQALGTWWRS